jgi:mono/diheme cytochrome c family protein
LSRLVRRTILTALTCAAAVSLLAAGCGSKGVTQAAPKTVIGTLPKATQERLAPAFKLKGDPAAGKPLFAKSGCGSCHTLQESHTTGTIGPNLDQAHPDYRLATARVTYGKSPMPSFKGQLTDQQIADVAMYVVKSTGGQAPGSVKP